MTDEAMTVAAEPAAAPSEPVSAPSGPSTPDTSARGAIDRAFASLDTREDQGGEPVVQEGQKRSPDGKFAANEPEPEPEAGTEPTSGTSDEDQRFAAPSRFSADAKLEWDKTPVSVRAEVDRAMREMEGGIQKYREAFEPWRATDEAIRANGQDPIQVIEAYRGIEMMLANDPLSGLDQICRNLGTDLATVAAHVMGQPVDQQQAQQASIIHQLRGEIAAMQEQIGGVNSRLQSADQQTIQRELSDFAKDKPRFDDLSPTMVRLIESGMAGDLAEAYDMAERLNPAPVTATPPAAPAAQPADPAQTRKGQLSLSGAPASGSNPATRKPAESARSALDRAFSTVGL